MFYLIVSYLFIIFLASDAKDTGYFWQLADIHCNLNYPNTTCNQPYGNYSCDSSPALAEWAIFYTKSLPDIGKPDFVIWSGDNTPHDPNLTKVDLINGVRILSDKIRSVYPVNETYVLPVLGNHDVYPANEMELGPTVSSRTDWCHRLATDPQLWAPWINIGNETASTTFDLPSANFSRGCFFSHLVQIKSNRLLLVSLNGLLWYTGNKWALNSTDSDPLGQLAWLEETFEWARGTKTKILIVSHFPAGASENSPRIYQHLRSDINDKFVQMMTTNADLLMAGLFAHQHVDSFRVLVNDRNYPVASILIAPSVSPFYLKGLGSPNPRIRLYEYDRKTATILGYSQYYLNLDTARGSNKDIQPPPWRLEYNTKSTYNLTSLNPSNLSKLFNSFLIEDDYKGYWSNYWKFELGIGRLHDPRPGYLTPPEQTCPKLNSQCRCEHLCAMRNLNLLNLQKCLTGCANLYSFNFPLSMRISQANDDTIDDNESSNVHSERSHLPIIIGVIIAFLVTLISVVLIVNKGLCKRHRRPGVSHHRSIMNGAGLFLTSLNVRRPSFLSHLNGSGDVSGSLIEPHHSLDRPFFYHNSKANGDIGNRMSEDLKICLNQIVNGQLSSSNRHAQSLKVLNSTNRHSAPLSAIYKNTSNDVYLNAQYFDSPNSILLSEHSSTNSAQVGFLSHSNPPEDYYADDEEEENLGLDDATLIDISESIPDQLRNDVSPIIPKGKSPCLTNRLKHSQSATYDLNEITGNCQQANKFTNIFANNKSANSNSISLLNDQKPTPPNENSAESIGYKYVRMSS